jgi:hypothetical protein
LAGLEAEFALDELVAECACHGNSKWLSSGGNGCCDEDSSALAF